MSAGVSVLLAVWLMVLGYTFVIIGAITWQGGQPSLKDALLGRPAGAPASWGWGAA